MALTEPFRIAILGTRFGEPDLEAEELAGLEVDFVLGPAATAEELLETAQGAVAILAGAPPIFSREVLTQLTVCRTIVRYGVGVDSVDVAAATELGIVVGHVPDYCTEEVSAHTMALILAGQRKLLAAHQGVLNDQWQVSVVKPLYSTENQTLGIVGFGKIGQAVARKAQPFGFEIVVLDPYIGPEILADHGARAVGLSELLTCSDVISLNVPLTESTHHMIDAAALAQMKPNAVLVNTSRGGLVDEMALAEALEKRQIAGAALDVFEEEPIARDHPLLQLERVLLTPHVAWYTEQAAERMRRMATREVARVLTGDWPVNLVNPDVKAVLAQRP